MTREEQDFIGAMNMCDEISNEAYKKIMCHCEEQEPCEDCIARQPLIDNWNSCADMLMNEGDSEIVMKWIFDAPSITPTQRWIPVSERLPEENGEYLITWTGILGEHGEKRTKPLLGIAEYEIYEPENYEDWITTGNEFEHYRDIKVSAWMPLPEPYKAERKEVNDRP